MASIIDSLRLHPSTAGIYNTDATLEQGALARGVFGGQVIALALTAASTELPKDGGFVLHSFHCYFLAAAASTVSLRFKVTLLRKGRSFLTYSVSASQNGAKVFGLMTSFKLPEPGSASYAVIRDILLANPDWSERLRANAELVIKETEDGPIEVLDCPLPGDPIDSRAYWMRARGIQKGQLPPAVQKTVLAYLSDAYIAGTSQRALDIQSPFASTPGGLRLAMIVSLDHAVYFYDGAFDLADWVLHVQRTIVGGDGRAVVNGRIYTRDGRLIAVTIQECLIRAKREDGSRL